MSRGAPRVLLASGMGVHPGIGGQGTFCANLAEQLPALGVRLELEGPEEWTPFCARHGLPWHPLGTARVQRFDLVHVNGPGLRALARARLHGKPAVVTHEDYSAACAHGTAFAGGACDAGPRAGPCAACPRRSVRDRAWLAAFRALLRTPGVAGVGISQAVSRRLGPVAPHVVHHPVQLLPDACAPAPGCEQLIAFAGRLVPHKGLGLLLKGLALVPGAQLEIAGDGPARPEAEALCASLGLSGRVQFRGMVPLDEVLALYRRAAVVAVPSTYEEPFGYALAEALSLGKAVLASDRGAFPELCGEGRGWLCAAEDEHAWAEALSQALADPAERARRGANARAFVASRLAPEQVARGYLALYRSLLGD